RSSRARVSGQHPAGLAARRALSVGFGGGRAFGARPGSRAIASRGSTPAALRAIGPGRGAGAEARPRGPGDDAPGFHAWRCRGGGLRLATLRRRYYRDTGEDALVMEWRDSAVGS